MIKPGTNKSAGSELCLPPLEGRHQPTDVPLDLDLIGYQRLNLFGNGHTEDPTKQLLRFAEHYVPEQDILSREHLLAN